MSVAVLLACLPGRPAGAQDFRTIVIDERLRDDLGLRLGSRVVLAPVPGEPGDTVIVAAVARRRADPSEIARAEYRIRMHLDQLQALSGSAERVDRFAVATQDTASIATAADAINAAAFGFRAHPSQSVAVETSQTFRVVSRFHRAIGVITIVASAIFLLCIMLLKVDERRRDVAALRLLGISRGTIIRSVVLEASLIALLGSALGVLLGFVSSAIVNRYYQGVYRTPLVFSFVTTEVVTLAVVLSLVLGIGAGAAAAVRLVSVRPLTLFGR
ncbi:MAG: FtsX-like permease family protein [Gemmatimonadaceae bacterium]|nr:FtsX-like permease family protein [Gemmatimonadaceae bacterium]